MAEQLISKMELYILSLDIDSTTKKYILMAFKKYADVIKKFYNNAYGKTVHANKSANDYLEISINNFKSRLQIVLESENNPFEYVTYILNNADMYNDSILAGETRNEKDRLSELYKKISKGNYIQIFYYEVLTYSSTNYNLLCFDIYKLARKMGYNDEAEDNILFSTDEKIHIGYSKALVPQNIKETVNNVE